jgi:hypothetical protein
LSSRTDKIIYYNYVAIYKERYDQQYNNTFNNKKSERSYNEKNYNNNHSYVPRCLFFEYQTYGHTLEKKTVLLLNTIILRSIITMLTNLYAVAYLGGGQGGQLPRAILFWGQQINWEFFLYINRFRMILAVRKIK